MLHQKKTSRMERGTSLTDKKYRDNLAGYIVHFLDIDPEDISRESYVREERYSKFEGNLPRGQ